MSDKIIVPALGESVSEATVSKWLKNQGEKVSADEPIVELETDKVNVEVPAPSNGVLEKISVKEGQTVNVGALTANHVVYHDRVEASWPLGLHFEAGSKVPVHCTSIGKLMLALKPSRDAETWLSKTELQRYTPRSKTNIPDLLADLEEIRAQDFSVDDQEFMDGVYCIAVPLRTSDGRVFAAMALSAPEARLSLNKLKKLLPELRRTAADYVLDLESQKNN